MFKITKHFFIARKNLINFFNFSKFSENIEPKTEKLTKELLQEKYGRPIDKNSKVYTKIDFKAITSHVKDDSLIPREVLLSRLPKKSQKNKQKMRIIQENIKRELPKDM